MGRHERHDIGLLVDNWIAPIVVLCLPCRTTNHTTSSRTRLLPFSTSSFLFSILTRNLSLVSSQKHIDFALTSPFGGGRPGRNKRKRSKAAEGGEEAADEE